MPPVGWPSALPAGELHWIICVWPTQPSWVQGSWALGQHWVAASTETAANNGQAVKARGPA